MRIDSNAMPRRNDTRAPGSVLAPPPAKTTTPERSSETTSNPLRVAYLVNQYPKPSHAFIRREIQALERQGVEVERIAIRGWEAPLVDPADIAEREKTRYLLKDGIAHLLGAGMRMALARPRAFVTALAMAVRLSRKEQRPLAYHLAYLAHACRIREWLVQSNAAHLHAHFGTNSAEVALLVRLLGGPPFSFTVHGPEEFDRGPSQRLDRKVAAAKFVVAISSYTRSQLFRVCDQTDWPKIRVVHCGLDAPFHSHSSGEPCSALRFVCVGRLCEQKGQLLLVEAFRGILDRHPTAELVLAGDGEMRPQIEARIRELGLDRHVRLTGDISSAEVRREIEAARALVLPSFQEGLPIVLMEALSLRRPVISTYVAGIPELVQHGETGWLVPAGSLSDLIAAMDTCLTTAPAELQRMGERGRVRVLERHDIDAEVTQLHHLFGAHHADAVTTR